MKEVRAKKILEVCEKMANVVISSKLTYEECFIAIQQLELALEQALKKQAK